MAYAMTKQGSLDNCVTYEFVCDTVNDMNAIENKYRTIGTVAIVLKGESGSLEVYMMSSNKEWVSITEIAGGSSGSSSTEIDLSDYAPLDSPEFINSISLNRKSGTTPGNESVAVGYHNAANGDYSTAVGRDTEANGTSSFAGGENTIAAGGEEFAIGCNNALPAAEWQANTAYAQNDYVVYNNKLYYCASPHTSAATFEQDSGWYHAKKNLLTIGNGNNSSSKSNAYTVDLWGNGHYKGDVYVGCNSDSSGGTKLEPLPAVTPSDEGKVLTVNSSGAWAAANASGGSVSLIIPKFTYENNQLTCDMTATEVLTAIENKTCISALYSEESNIWYGMTFAQNIGAANINTFMSLNITTQGVLEMTQIGINNGAFMRMKKKYQLAEVES